MLFGILILLGFCSCRLTRNVSRPEFEDLSGRVSTLEDIVITRRARNPNQPLAQLPPDQLPPAQLSTSTQPLPALPGSPGPTGTQLGPLPGTPPVGHQAARPTANERTRYNQALAMVKQKKYREAASAFTSFLNDFPGSALAPNARYWLGECHYVRGDFTGALNEFRRGYFDFPQSRKAPDYLLKMAYSQSRLGDGPGAMESVRVLLERYPSSNSATLVKSGRSRFP
ncbi:MAG: tol-pal system protein YbgF [Deltaproteobacteria bacterium]|jgi:tol-pal system protein YbgF|nr:tol-pal system protein YbgF [Deltaproteobacteria bacterium]